MRRLIVGIWLLLPSVALSADPLPSSVLKLTDWKLTLPVDTPHPGKPDEIRSADLLHFSDTRFFFVNDKGDGVVFRAPCGGATTKGSNYPRSELREMAPSGKTSAAWSTADAGQRELAARLAVTQTPPVKRHVVCAQIHDGDNDVLMIRLEGKKLLIERTGEDDVILNKDYVLGTPFDLRIVVRDGVVEVWHNDTSALRWNVSREECYFKVGCYTQSNTDRGDAAESLGEVVVYSLRYTRP